MKKIILIGSIIVLIFVILIGLQTYSKNEKMKNNPYDKEDLNAATIDLLDNEDYQDIILMEDLNKKIEDGETFVAYFFSPLCMYCQAFTPSLMDIANEYDFKVYKFNLLEYPEGANKFEITGTPTTIVFSKGKEVNRMVGQGEDEQVIQFFKDMGIIK